jgi:hypothetical protein
MEIRISYALSQETRAEYEEAIEKVRKKQGAAKPYQVIDVEIQEVAPGQFAGVIIMDRTV